MQWIPTPKGIQHSSPQLKSNHLPLILIVILSSSRTFCLVSQGQADLRRCYGRGSIHR